MFSRRRHHANSIFYFNTVPDTLNPITHVANFAINNGIIIFLVTLFIFLGKSLDKFVKKKSKAAFARNFLRAEAMNCQQAAQISLEALDSVFKSKLVLSIRVPNVKRLYVVSVVIASAIMLYYLLISSDNYSATYLISKDAGKKIPVLIFETAKGNFEFILTMLLPLLILLVNPVLDFFSYGETRFLLEKMISTLEKENKSQFFVVLSYCAIDLLYSFGLFVLFIYGARNVFESLVFGFNLGVKKAPNFLETIKGGIREPFVLVDSYFSGLGVDGLYGGILLSTFVSTLFVWYVFSAFFIAFLQKYISRILSYINEHTHIIRIFMKKPFGIIAYVFSAIAITIDLIVRQVEGYS